MDLNRIQNENEEAYIWRLGTAKETGEADITWTDIASLVNKAFRSDETEYYSEAAYRKAYQHARRFCAAGVLTESDGGDCSQEDDVPENRRKEIQTIKYRDERNAWARQNRERARLEASLDALGNIMEKAGRVEFPAYEPVRYNGDKTVVVMLSDLHIGATFDNYWGKYNTEVARDRLGQLLEEVKAIAKLHEANECYVTLLGDQISGGIHFEIAVTDRENKIEQIKIASELISSFCYELSKVFSSVTMVSVAGNHSRLGKKKECLSTERGDDLVAWIVGKMLSHVDNFRYLEEANLDNSIALFSVRDKWMVAVHGDHDDFNKSGIQGLVSMIRAIPTACLMGHRHHCAVDDINGIKMVQGGSLCGSGDAHTVNLRLNSGPSQMVCVCSDRGIETYYPVELE